MVHKCEGCGQRCLCDGEEYDWYAAPIDCQCDHRQLCEKCGAVGAKWKLGMLLCGWCAAVPLAMKERLKKLAADALRTYVKPV